MSDTHTKKHPSPTRTLRAWLFRERAVRGPAAIELDVVDRQLTREETAVRTCVGEAKRIETGLQKARVALQSALTDRRTPGIVTADESRAIARSLNTVAVDATHHTQQLEALT
jgi:hypothetical protein